MGRAVKVESCADKLSCPLFPSESQQSTFNCLIITRSLALLAADSLA